MYTRRKFITGAASLAAAVPLWGAPALALPPSDPNARYGYRYWRWRVARTFAKRWRDEYGTNYYLYWDLGHLDRESKINRLVLESEHFVFGQPYGLLDSVSSPFHYKNVEDNKKWDAEPLSERIASTQAGLHMKADIRLSRIGYKPHQNRRLLYNAAKDGELDRFEYVVPDPSFEESVAAEMVYDMERGKIAGINGQVARKYINKRWPVSDEEANVLSRAVIVQVGWLMALIERGNATPQSAFEDMKKRMLGV